MSLTSYRAAPPRGSGRRCQVRECAGTRLLVWGPSRSLLCKELSGGSGKPSAYRGAAFGRPGSDLLSRALRRSTIGAEGFHGRVRDGIGCVAPRCGHQAIETQPGHERRLLGELLAVSSWLLAKSQQLTANSFFGVR